MSSDQSALLSFVYLETGVLQRCGFGRHRSKVGGLAGRRGDFILFCPLIVLDDDVVLMAI